MMNFEGELHGSLFELDERLKGVGPLRWSRRMRRRLLESAIVSYPGRDTENLHGVWTRLTEQRLKEDYGNPILVYILSWLAVEGIKLLIAWLKERHTNEVMIRTWQYRASQS